MGMQQLIAGLPDTCQVALEYLARCAEEDVVLLSENLKRYLPFLRPCFAPPKQSKNPPFALFDRTRVNMAVFFASLRSVMQEVNSSHREKFLKRLSGFPGVAGEVHQLIGDLWGAEQARAFDTLIKQAYKHLVKRQLMLFVSYTCNLQCPYCFVQDLKEPDLPMQTARELLDWAQANGVTTITFCGGEPTIYPYFPVLLDELKARGLRTYFATNLLVGPGVFERLQPSTVDALIVHVAHPDTYKGKQWAIFQENVKVVLQQDVPLALRINMYAQDHDWSQLFDLAEKFGLKEVQLALTFPNARANNQFVRVDAFKALIPAVLQFMNSCEQSSLRVVFSKPLPLCLFPEAMQDALLHQSKYAPTCSVFLDGCTHNVCISPGGNVSPCLALLDISKPFSQFQNWNDLSSFCQTEILPLLSQPLLEQCSDCFLFERRLCQGGCLGHKKSRQIKKLCHD